MDSLEQLLVVETDIDKKGKLLHQIAWRAIVTNENEKAIKYIHEYEKFGRLTANREIGCHVQNLLGVYSIIRERRGLALKFFTNSYDCAKYEGLDNVVMSTGSNLALMYMDKGQSSRALEYHRYSYNKAVELKDTSKMQLYLLNIGYDQVLLKSYEEAMKTLKKGENLLDTFKGKEINTKFFDKRGLCYLYMSMASERLGKIDIAERYIEQAIPILKQSGNNYSVVSAFIQKTKVHLKRNEKALAKYTFKRAINIAQSGNYTAPLIEAYEAYSKFLLDEQNYEEAIRYAQNAFDLLNENKGKALYGEEIILEVLYKSHQKQGNLDKAYKYNYLYNTVKDSVILEKQHTAITNLDYERQLSLKKDQNKILHSEQKANEALLKKDSFLFVVFLSMLGVFAVLMVVMYRGRKYIVERNKKLEKLVRERTTQLKKHYERLEVTKSELERFAHITSHDLKEPLRNIGSFLGLIARRSKSKMPEDAKKEFDSISHQVVKMERFIDEALSFYGVNEDNLPVKNVDVNNLLFEIEEEYFDFFQQRNAKLVFGDIPQIHINRFQLKTILKSLIINGVEYNNSEAPRVEVRHHFDSGKHLLSVQDNGVGIKTEDYQKAFALFERLDNAKGIEGTGMGLPICKRVIEKNNGRIMIDSELGKGSIFKVYLPVSVNTVFAEKTQESIVNF